MGVTQDFSKPQHVLDYLAGDIEEVKESTGPTADDDSDARLTAVERAVKWASPWRNVAVIAGFVIAGGVAAYTSLRSYAKRAVIETVIEAHGGENPQIEPSVPTVQAMEADLASVKGGVDCLVAEQHHQKEMKEIEVALDLHRQQYEQLLQAWSANKAARRNAGKYPGKSDGHIALEGQLKTLAGKSTEQCKEGQKQ